ncbi:hypothetical protein L7F22_041398 [Adiantum nelumboides]|nr:hypothetical protein [Adiantum nelumboides]
MAAHRYNLVSGVYGLDTCYHLPSQDLATVAGLPLIELLFEGGVSLPLDPFNLFEYFEEGQFHCLMFLPQQEGRLFSVIGNFQMMGAEFTFDLTNNKIGMLRGACSFQ